MTVVPALPPVEAEVQENPVPVVGLALLNHQEELVKGDLP